MHDFRLDMLYKLWHIIFNGVLYAGARPKEKKAATPKKSPNVKTGN